MAVERKEKKRKSPKAGLSVERVVAAAVALADSEGLAKLSMRRLAQTLGVEAMSLYNHVAGKEALLDAMVEAVAREFAPPRLEVDWQDALRARALAAHAAMLRHPWAPPLLLSRAHTGPVMLGYVDATLGCLRAAGFTYQQADRIWNALDSFIYGFTLQELSFPFAPEAYGQAARDYLPMIPQDRLPHLHALTREVAEGRHYGTQSVEFGLELLLAGFARLRAPG